jgi:hypothetical protein
MLDCRRSSVLWHLEISSSRRSDQRLVIPNHFMRKSLIYQGMNKILRTSQLMASRELELIFRIRINSTTHSDQRRSYYPKIYRSR